MWRTGTIAELCEIEYGTRVVRKQEQGTIYPVYGGGGETFRVDRKNRTDRVVISRFGMSEQCTRYVNGDFFLNDSGLTLSPKAEELSQNFLNKVIFSLNDKIYALGRGAAQKNLDMNAFKSIHFSYPPLAEQQRIVAKLDAAFAEIDRAIEIAGHCKDNALRFYAHTIDALFSDYASQTVALGDLSSINYGYTAKASHEKGTYKFLRITDIQENTVNWESVPYCEVDKKKLSKLLLHDGDIVFARTGATTGKSFLLEDPKDAVFASYLIRVSVDRNKLIPRYVMHYFQSASYWDQVDEGISGAAQGGFNASKLSELKIPLIPKDTQEALIQKLDDMLVASKDLAAIHLEKSQQLSQLKSAILAQELQPSEAA